MTDLEALAARVAPKLTKAQREVLQKIGGGRRRAINFAGATAAALRFPTATRPALTDRDITYDHGRRMATYRLTEAGHAVRAHLTAGATHDR